MGQSRAPSAADTRTRVIEELVRVRRRESISELTARLTAKPTERIESMIAEAVIAGIEGALGVEIPQVDEWPQSRPLTFEALVEHIDKHCRDADPDEQSR